MGYSKSKRVIKRVETYLQQMVAAPAQFEFPADDASKFAYALREGIYSARHFAAVTGEEPYISYAKLHSKYIIRTEGSRVICEPRDVILSVKAQTLGQVTIPEVERPLEIIGAAVMHKAPVMIFSDASDVTLGEDAARVKTWCDKNNYELIISDNHVTLTRKPDA